MKRTLLIIISVFAFSNFVFAGPFVSINSVDTSAKYPDVNIEVSVIGHDNGEIHGLDEDNLQVYEDGYRVNYVKVSDRTSDRGNLYLVFAIDSSKSIGEKFLHGIKKNAKSILQGASPNDKIALYRFNDRVKLISNFTSNRSDIVRGIKSISRHGSKTKLYDAVYDSVSLLSRVKSERRAVVIFTDGTDDGSSLESSDIISHAKEKKIPLYFVTLKGASGSRRIARIAKLSGGRSFYINSSHQKNIYGMILSSIKSIYHINYKSLAERNNAEHKLEVRLKYNDLKDRDLSTFKFERKYFKFNFINKIPGLKIFGAVFSVLLFVFLMAYIARLMRNQKKSQEIKGADVNSFYESDLQAEALVTVEDDYDENHPIEVPDVMYSDAWLQRRGGAASSHKIPLLKGDAVIGYGRENSISVDDDSASSSHSRIRRIEGGYYLFDLISDRGTYLNGKKLLRPRLLHDWDEIQVGKTVFIFRGVR